jgi:hypothetical protein
MHFFVYSSVLVLILTSMAKIISSSGSAPILEMSDPVFNISYRVVFLVVAGIELIIAGICAFTNRIWLQVGLLSWLATCFIAYRLDLKFAGIRYCPCLGTVVDSLPISRNTADSILLLIVVYLTIGGYASLLWLYWQTRKLAVLKS